MLNSFKPYLRLMRLHRPVGIWLLLWPTLWALLVASQGKLDWKILIVFFLGVIIMRSAGCVINDIADRNIDGRITRTKDRPLATGQITLKSAYILFFFLCLFALLLVLQLNRMTIELSLIGLLLAIIYPFTKRYTYWPQLILGAAFAWAIPMAFAALNNTIPPITWLIYIISVLWAIAYDTQYAMVDREDDRQIGIKSTALLFGKYDCLIISFIQLTIIALLLVLGLILKLNIYYYAGLVIATSMFIYQYGLTKTQLPPLCFKAFLNNQWVGFSIFLGILFNYLLIN